MRQPVSLTIPQPCHQSWAAMTPVNAGRHCAACEKTVVDFTLKTDAEILAFLAGATSGRTCGRFAAGQLKRPLQRVVLAAPTRWRAWLAAAVAVWAVREGVGESVKAQAPTEWRARYWGGPVSAAPPVAKVAADTVVGKHMLRGIVRDSAAHLGLPGATVMLKNTQIGVSTDEHGAFVLVVPSEYVTAGTAEIQVHYIGYLSQDHQVPVEQNVPACRFFLQADVKGMLAGELVVAGGIHFHRPWPWHPRNFYNWSKYWLTRPFRGY